MPRPTRPQSYLPLMLCALLSASCVAASPSRIKDLAVINGLGRHKLLGYGLVAGLEGTGDSDSSALTARTIGNMLDVFGVVVSSGDFSAKNVAAVMVTAELPPIVAVGDTLDITVSSLGDAKSLQGGTLLLSPLKAADGEVYALAQGPITVGGFSAETRGGDAVQKNHVNVGRVPNGASAVKPVNAAVLAESRLTISLLQPDFTTALRIAEAINTALGQCTARALDNATVQVAVPPAEDCNLVSFIASLENLTLEPDTAARVVINERTGTVVIGEHVRIAPVAICHGGLTVQVKAETQVSQPPLLVSKTAPAPAVTEPATTQSRSQTPAAAGGRTVVVRQDDVKVRETGGRLVAIPEQATLHDLVTALNALGVKPRDLIAIIQALKEAHALEAELVLF